MPPNNNAVEAGADVAAASVAGVTAADAATVALGRGGSVDVGEAVGV